MTHRVAMALVLVSSLPADAFGGEPLCSNAGLVAGELKISTLSGGFGGTINDDDYFGRSVAALGDLDGDGVGDIAVGGSRDNVTGSDDSGAVWIVFLNDNGTVKGQRKITEGINGFGGLLDPDDYFGISLASLGDLDGDGTGDLAVGAALDDDGGDNHGAIWVLFLNSNGTVKSEQQISATSGGFAGTLDDSDKFGISMSSLGDFDGDGVVDLAVGAIEDLVSGIEPGAVWILLLNADGTVKGEQRISDDEGGFGGVLNDADNFGIAVSPIGDLDGDDVLDIAVGANLGNDGGADRGSVWILFLNADGTVKAEQEISDLAGAFDGVLDNADSFGISLAPLGDVDGDRHGDIAVGATGDDDGGANRGCVWILFLNADGSAKASSKISDELGGFEGELANNDGFGISIAPLGDLDGDGYFEFAVGANLDNDGGDDAGAVWILTLDDCIGAPLITAQPETVVLPTGGGIAQFSVMAIGDPALSYQVAAGRAAAQQWRLGKRRDLIDADDRRD